MQEKILLDSFKNFDIAAFWRLFIDGNRQDSSGPGGFDEREPNYLKSLQNAFDVALEFLTQPLTVDGLTKLHDKSIEFTKTVYNYETNEGLKQYYKSFHKGIRDTTTEFGLIPTGANTNFTLEGIRELLTEMVQGDDYFKLEIREEEEFVEEIEAKDLPIPLSEEYVSDVYEKLSGHKRTASIIINNRDPVFIKDRLAKIISEYNANIETLKTSTESESVINRQKISFIAKLIHDLEITHPFTDANCRTFIILLMPVLLMKEGFTPSIVENPNQFEAFSTNELVEAIIEGFSTFQYFRKNKDEPVKGHEEDKLLFLNPTTIFLIAVQATLQIKHWNEINPSEKEKAIDIIKKSLAELKSKAFSFSELAHVLETIQEVVSDAVYKKSFYQISLFTQPNNYGIHFDTVINRSLYRPLGLDSLSEKIGQSLQAPALSK